MQRNQPLADDSSTTIKAKRHKFNMDNLTNLLQEVDITPEDKQVI